VLAQISVVEIVTAVNVMIVVSIKLCRFCCVERLVYCIVPCKVTLLVREIASTPALVIIIPIRWKFE